MACIDSVVTEIGKNVFEINEYGHDLCYLICGNHRALMIGPESRTEKIKKTVQELCLLPYDVALPYADPENLDDVRRLEEYYLHERDWKNVAEDCLSGMKKLEDGSFFDLGDTKVHVVYTGGHTEGSCCFIDDRSRIAFAQALEGGTEQAGRMQALKTLYSHRNEFDRLYIKRKNPGIESRSLQKDYLEDCIRAAELFAQGKNRVNLANGECAAVYGQATFLLEKRDWRNWKAV